MSDIGATIVHYYESINSETIVRFFCKLRENYPLTHKLQIILDGVRYHRNDLFRDTAFVRNIELYYLSPYSLNINPIERLWKVMNKKLRNNVYFRLQGGKSPMFFCDYSRERRLFDVSN
uniref:Tc1-like transposase DDE domain-containing protein n=1 Tax=Vibrio parahaemolyticus TaxID=670 RepID=A0A5P5X5D1_VIBPH|nr:hypothetical protein [Vibrio parahaemolyticus]